MLTMNPVNIAHGGGGSTARNIVLYDDQPYYKGSYVGFIAPYGAGTYVYGTNYTETMTVNQTTFPSNTNIVWSWPNVASSGVYSYLAIDFGNYNNTNPIITPLTPKTVSTINTLTVTNNTTIAGNTSNFDVIIDFYLTTTQNNFTTKVYEIEIFLHSPAYVQTYVNNVANGTISGGTTIGTYTDANSQNWLVAKDPTANGGTAPDLLFMPVGNPDLLNNTIDIKAMLTWLLGKSAITGGLYFNGLSFGCEVNENSGSALINNLSATYS